MNENKLLNFIQSKKLLVPFFVVLILISSLFIAKLVKNADEIKEIDVTSYKKENIKAYSYYIDEFYYEDSGIYLKDDIVKMSGWIVKPNIEVKDISIKVVFKDMVTNRYYRMPTLMVSRNEVTSFVEDGYNHQYSGFSMNVKYDKLDRNTDYKIYILYSINGTTYLVDLNYTLKINGERHV